MPKKRITTRISDCILETLKIAEEEAMSCVFAILKNQNLPIKHLNGVDMDRNGNIVLFLKFGFVICDNRFKFLEWCPVTTVYRIRKK